MEKVQARRFITILAALMCACALCFAMCGCGGGDAKANFVGEWELDSMEDPSLGTVDASSLKAFGLTVTMTLNADGSGSFSLFGETIDATWEAKSATEMSLTLAGEGSTTFTLQDSKLVGEESGSKMTFAKVTT